MICIKNGKDNFIHKLESVVLVLKLLLLSLQGDTQIQTEIENPVLNLAHFFDSSERHNKNYIGWFRS